MPAAGPKVGDAFMKLSFEEKHALMSATAKIPDEFMQESLAEYYIGADGMYCNTCKASPEGVVDGTVQSHGVRHACFTAMADAAVHACAERHLKVSGLV